MFKKLDKLILKSFLGPFIITFFIAVFVLMMQVLWKYIDDLVGKGLDMVTWGKFIWYAAAALISLAMPIAILISSIMSFGNLGESFELVAIKSSGISLLRFMRPLIFLAVIMCGISYLFANYVIPVTELKFVTLYNDIVYKKPAFALKEGVFFTQIPNYVIRAESKEKGDSIINDVLVYEQSNPLQDNAISAKKGLMVTRKGSSFLEFNLKDGYRYQETGQFGDTATEFVRLHFKEFKKLFDLSGLKLQKTNDSVFKNSTRMMSTRQLNIEIDSMVSTREKMLTESGKVVSNYFHYLNLKDSVFKKALSSNVKATIPDSIKQLIKDRSVNVFSEIKSSLDISATAMQEKNKNLRYAQFEWHKKYSLSLACLVLLFIGAPLGSIIRKGGLGMPLVVAIVFFLIFHLLNMFGEKFVKEGILPAWQGMWLAVAILSPVGAFFTYKAMNDSQIFNKERYLIFYRRVKEKLLFRKKKEYDTEEI